MRNVSQRFPVMKVSVCFMAILVCCHGDQNSTDQYLSSVIADLWLEGGDVVRIIWRDCSKKLVDVKDVIDHKEYFPKFLRCMKRKTLRALDRALSPDVVPISEGINLVRYELVDHTGNVMADNETSPWSEQELEEGEWRTLALQRMAKVLRTHVIKFDFGNERTVDKAEYRGRRRHQMLTMMMFGVVSIGMVMVPMGFQFLAVLGGKALLLAKMALILASIQGLKKIATGPLNYGFYHSFPPYEHFEKRSQDGSRSPENLQPSNFIRRDDYAKTGFPSKSWDSIDTGGIKVDRIHIAEDDIKIVKRETEGPRTIYPSLSNPVYSAIDSPLADLTTRPGEVQADYSLDLPYHGFRFQSPTPVFSS